MPIRLLTPLELEYIEKIVQLGTSDRWEYAVFLNTSNGPLIDFVRGESAFRAEPTPKVHDAIDAGAKVILHHNHLSQGSLTMADWRGAACVFDEVFAHSADGSMYYGRVVDRSAVMHMVENDLSMTAGSLLSKKMREIDEWDLSTDVGIWFEPEVLNRAMFLKGYVEYGYQWGNMSVLPSHQVLPHLQVSAGVLGAKFNRVLDEVARELAQRL